MDLSVNSVRAERVHSIERYPGWGFELKHHRMLMLTTSSNESANENLSDIAKISRDLNAIRSEMDVIRSETSSINRFIKLEVSRPFFADGETVIFLDAKQLSTFLPKSPDTLIDWAQRGIIPGICVPGSGKGKFVLGRRKRGKGSWVFNLTEVKRALDKFHV